MDRLRAPGPIGPKALGPFSDHRASDATSRRRHDGPRLPKTNMVAFELEGGSRVIARPSGTEPKVKFYFDVREDVKPGEALDAAEKRARGGHAGRIRRLREARRRVSPSMRRAVLLLGIAACSDPIPASKNVPGFVMPVEKTAIAVGAPTTTTDVDGLHRVEGPTGFFQTFVVTGGTAGAVTDATLLGRAAAYTTVAAHENAARAHFAAAGLPAGQVAGATSRAVVGADGKTRFTTTLTRQIEGFDVVESAATVTFVEGGVATDEQVFWPGFLRTVIDDANALRNEDPTFLERLPTTNKVGVVVLHHATWKTVPFTVFASLDIVDGTVVRHFDVDGNEKTLPP